MALNLPVVSTAKTGDYISFLHEELDRRSPALRERNVWGLRTLREVFHVDMQRLLSRASDVRNPSILSTNLQHIAEVESGLLPPETVIAGVGFDFSSVPEPYCTEVKAALSLWMAAPHMHIMGKMRKLGWIIPFARSLARSATAKGLLADYEPDQLNSLFASWMVAEGRMPSVICKSSHAKIDATGVSRLVEVEYIWHNHPAAVLANTLDVLRERHKPMSKRDFILHRDLFPNEPRSNHVTAFYKGYNMRVFRVPFFRDAVRAYLVSIREHLERLCRVVV